MDTSIKHFRVSRLQQITLFSRWLLVYFFLLVIYFIFNSVSLDVLKIGCVLAFILDTAPALILHLQYFLENKHSMLKIDNVQKKLSFTSPRLKTELIDFDLIKSLKFYASYGSGAGYYSFAYYRYYKLELVDGRYFFITCLMINKIEEKLEKLLEKKAEENFCFYPLIRKRFE